MEVYQQTQLQETINMLFKLFKKSVFKRFTYNNI